MIYVSINLETTGINPTTCQILEIGAIAQKLGGEKLGIYSAIIKYNTLHGSPFALNLNQRLIKFIAEGKGQSQLMAATGFLAWLGQYKNSENRIVAAGKNFAGFDRPFLEAFDERFGSMFFRRVLDPAILYTKMDDDLPPNLSTCLLRAGLPSEVTHNALDDAEQVVQLIEHSFATMEVV